MNKQEMIEAQVEAERIIRTEAIKRQRRWGCWSMAVLIVLIIVVAMLWPEDPIEADRRRTRTGPPPATAP